MDITPAEWVEMVTIVDQKVRSGVPRETALRAAGISKTTYALWASRGADGEEPYASWMQSLDVAEAEAEASDVEKIRQNKSWQAQAWLLERKNPDKWGQKIQIEVAKELDKVFAIAAEVLPIELYEKLLKKIAASDGGEARAEVSSAAKPQPDRLH